MKDLIKKEKGVKLEYKRVKAYKQVCPDCGEVLGGNNSIAMPLECYKCKVQWISNYGEPFLYFKKKI